MRISRLDPQMTLHTRISQIKINRAAELTMKLITYYLSGPEASLPSEMCPVCEDATSNSGGPGIFSHQCVLGFSLGDLVA